VDVGDASDFEFARNHHAELTSNEAWATNMPTLLEQALGLNVEEKLQLISALWDDMAQEPRNIPEIAWHMDEFQRRIDSQRTNFQSGQSWDHVKRSIEPRKLPEIRVILQRVAPGERAVALDYPDSLGVRTKLGGEPDWAQGDQTPRCDSCGIPMTFVAQIDSIEHDNRHNPLRRDCRGGHQDYMFGDVGMIYLFYCFDCGQTACLEQGY
jgi:putative addiction module component (TIGR02574 family)